MVAPFGCIVGDDAHIVPLYGYLKSTTAYRVYAERCERALFGKMEEIDAEGTN